MFYKIRLLSVTYTTGEMYEMHMSYSYAERLGKQFGVPPGVRVRVQYVCASQTDAKIAIFPLSSRQLMERVRCTVSI